MKRIITPIITALMLLSLASSGADTLFCRFNNYAVVEGTPHDTLIFDVEIQSNTTGTYLTSIQLDILYNPVVFGDSVIPVQYTDMEMISPGMWIVLGPLPSAYNHFRYARTPFLGPYYPSSFSLVPHTSWGKLVRIKMLVIDNSQNLGVDFKISAMAGQQRFIKTITNTQIQYVPVVASNNLLNLPSTPTVLNLMISELADPSDSNADFVEIYNAGDYPVDFSQYPWYLTMYDGSIYQHIQLTGTLNAGDAHVIGGPSFTAAYPGKTADQTATFIENNGTVSYFLSTFGEYNVGTSIDHYNGATAAFTGKQAVRPYKVVTPSTTFDPNEWKIISAVNIDMTPGSHRMTITWDGSSSDVWRDTTNWTPPFVPDIGHNANVPDNLGPLPVIPTGNTVSIHDLIIDGGSK